MGMGRMILWIRSVEYDTVHVMRTTLRIRSYDSMDTLSTYECLYTFLHTVLCRPSSNTNCTVGFIFSCSL